MRRLLWLALVAACGPDDRVIAVEPPGIPAVRTTVRGDTALIDLEPVAGARDYRVYELPDPADVTVLADGRRVVRNAIYRCGGDRQLTARAATGLAGAEILYFHTRSASGDDRVLGHVWVTPGAGRVPVWRMGDPDFGGKGESSGAWLESRRPEYAAGEAEHARLVALGWRDDGVVFYAPEPSAATRPVTRWQSTPQACCQEARATVLVVPGAEKDALERWTSETARADVRFHVLAAPSAGTVPLFRVFEADGAFDVVAAGEARLERVLTQGNQPVWFLEWTGLTRRTRLVVEALDAGCPYAGGTIGVAHVDGTPPILTVDEARLPESGELFVNGQHDPRNRPRAIARAFVDVEPAAPPAMDWFEGFTPGAAWASFEVTSGNNGVFLHRNARWFADFTYSAPRLAFGPLFGELVVDHGDIGSMSHVRMTPRDARPTLAADRYLHARMEVDLPSTGRRYPQLIVSTVAPREVSELDPGEPLELASLQEQLASGDTVVVQPVGRLGVGPNQPIALEIRRCDHLAWSGPAPCPAAQLAPSLPMPALAELAGFDRRVLFELYLSTTRAYVFLEGRPAACAVLPAPAMPAGAVTVSFGSILFHSAAEEAIGPVGSTDAQYAQIFVQDRRRDHVQRHFDNLGISSGVAEPEWPAGWACSTDWR